MSGDIKWTSDSMSDMKVRVFGDAAVVTGRETLQGTAKGYVPGPRRVTDIWVKRNGRWQQLGGQTTIVAPTNAQDIRLRHIDVNVDTGDCRHRRHRRIG
jgi:ketosteroid isomerase-like protein